MRQIMRIAMLSVHTCPLAPLGSRETGGMNVYIRELSRHLGRMGVAVDVFTRRQATDVDEVVEFGSGARVVHLPAGPSRPMDKYKVLDHLSEFAENIEAFRVRESVAYDVVHGHYWLSAPVAADLAGRWGAPVISMFHTLGRVKNHVSTNGHETEQSIRITIEQEAMARSQRLVAASPTDMQQMLAYYGADPARIEVVPEGVDTDLFRPIDKRVARSLAGFGSGPQVLFVGRIQQLKGIDLLLHAFALVLARWDSSPRPRLTVVGGMRLTHGEDPDHGERNRLKDIAGSLGIADFVEFRDAVPHADLPAFYSAADVVVMPSTYESFGLVALEAMASGTPVVASRVGGLQWTVRDGETGFLVSRRSPEAFATALYDVLADGETRTRMSLRAAEVAGTFSWDSVAQKIASLYEGVMPRCAGRLLTGACLR